MQVKRMRWLKSSLLGLVLTKVSTKSDQPRGKKVNPINNGKSIELLRPGPINVDEENTICKRS